MLVRALRCFAGANCSMRKGEKRDLKADEANRLIRAGHVEKVGKQAELTEDDKKQAELTKENEAAENEDKPDDAE